MKQKLKSTILKPTTKTTSIYTKNTHKNEIIQRKKLKEQIKRKY